MVVCFTDGENHRSAAVTDKLYHIMPERDSNINGDRHWLHIQLPCDYVSPNDSFGEDEKFKMTTSYVKVYTVALWEIHYHLSERH